MRQTVYLLIALMVVPAVAYAGPPMLTDDPGTPGNRKWEINIGASIEQNTFEDRFLFPFFDLNYGLGERIQLKYEVPWVTSIRKEDDSSLSGPGNSVFGVKCRFLDEDKQGIAASVYPQAEFNNGDSAERGLVDKGTMVFLPLEIQKQLGWLGVDGEVGYLFKPGDDEWIYGLLLGHKFEKVEVLAELHGTGLRNFRHRHDVVNFGVRWDFAENTTLNASIGSSLRSRSEENPSLISYIGIQFRL